MTANKDGMGETMHLGIWNPGETNMEDFLKDSVPHDGKWREISFKLKYDLPSADGDRPSQAPQGDTNELSLDEILKMPKEWVCDVEDCKTHHTTQREALEALLEQERQLAKIQVLESLIPMGYWTEKDILANLDSLESAHSKGENNG